MLGRGGDLRWSEVRKLWYRPWSKWFWLHLADGRAVRVSAMLTGLPAFARAALAEVIRARSIPIPSRSGGDRRGELPKISG